MPPAECWRVNAATPMNDAQKKVLNKLESMCARREYCSSDILKKAVERLDGDTAAAAQLLDSLKAGGYVDDLRYASAFAREKSSITGWGEMKIRFALRVKRIDESIIVQALNEIDCHKSAEKLERLLAVKWRSLKGADDAKLKLIRFALSRGYEYDEVRPAVEKVTCGDQAI